MSTKGNPSKILPLMGLMIFFAGVCPARSVAAEEAKDVFTVQSREVSDTVTLGGTVVPFRDVTLSAQIPGRIRSISGTEGDAFNKGVVLVSIEESDLLAKRDSAQAELAKAQSMFQNNNVQFNRQVYSGSPMASDNMGMGMPRMFDRAFTRPFSSMMGMDNPGLSDYAQNYAHGVQVQQAHMSIIQAQSAIKEINAKLRDARSIAPFNGIITVKHVEKGDTVQPGMPLVSFADPSRLRIKVDVPARIVAGIKKDMVIQARLDINDAMVETKVVQIYPMADPQRHTVTVKLELTEKPSGHGLLGMYAEVMIPDHTSQAKSLPTVPRAAVIWRGSLPAVLALVENGSPELRMVRLGGFVDKDFVSVLSGLKDGEKIVANNPAALMTGWGERAENGIKQ
ncbi:MAG TPA: efflux RND transporter periplasmic adaptor subunit, partial [Magnetococcales bacterium]|nr:efflux RND transporter periplasmic adaptor subunit [Magnetococcales bacterium]